MTDTGDERRKCRKNITTIYLPYTVKKAFDKKLAEEFEYAPSRSRMIRVWIDAYVGDRLKIMGESE